MRNTQTRRRRRKWKIERKKNNSKNMETSVHKCANHSQFNAWRIFRSFVLYVIFWRDNSSVVVDMNGNETFWELFFFLFFFPRINRSISSVFEHLVSRLWVTFTFFSSSSSSRSFHINWGINIIITFFRGYSRMCYVPIKKKNVPLTQYIISSCY